MKILLATPYGGVPGGISRWAGHIMEFYNSKGFKDCDLTLLPMGRSTFVNTSSGLFYRLRTAAVDYKEILSNFKKLIRDNKFNVMHLASSASISLLKDLYMLNQARSKDIKTVVHFRFGRIPELSVQKNWEWKLLVRVVKTADKVIVIDQKSYDTLNSFGFKNISFLPNPVAPQVCQIVENNQHIIRESKYILFTGHVLKTKGVYELVESCSQLVDIRLKLVGHVNDDIKEELYKLAKCNIEIVGELPYEEVIKEMLKCDVFVLPTYTEGFPNVILESMAAGCAIVTTTVGAIPQMLESDSWGKYGILVPPQNVLELNKAIVLMLSDENLKMECRKNVKLRVSERYSIETVWAQMIHIWTELMN